MSSGIPGLDMGQGNSVSTSNAQQTKNEQAFKLSGNNISFGGSGLDLKTGAMIAGAIVVGFFLLGRK